MNTTTKETEPVYQAVGARIRMLRDVLGIEQHTLAERTGLSRASIANIEAGRQRIYMHHVETIARALGTHTKGLMKGIWW